jgi:hypothetical protein
MVFGSTLERYFVFCVARIVKFYGCNFFKSFLKILALIFTFSANYTNADSISYAYDELGRVTQASNITNGQAAVYTYDAVGNITSQKSVALDVLSISSFTPNRGNAGTSVTIVGTGFSTTPTSNTVKFNGSSATVTTATATQLVVIAPSGVTTGPISITKNSTSVTSAIPFTVVTGAVGSPTISGFTPTSGIAGTNVTINGTQFQSNVTKNKVWFNTAPAAITSATSTVLTATVPPIATSGPIKVFTPYGSATSSVDFTVPPPGISSVASTQRLVLNADVTAIAAATGTTVLALFEGIQGDELVRVVVTSGTGTAKVIGPFGEILASGTVPVLLNLGKLPSTGTYSVAISASGTSSSNFYVNVTTPIVDELESDWDTTTSVVNLKRGQRAVFDFLGAAGQHTLLEMVGNLGNWQYEVRNASGANVWSASATASTTELYIPALPYDGPYKFIADPLFDKKSFKYRGGIISQSPLVVGTIQNLDAGSERNGVGYYTRTEISAVAGDYVSILTYAPSPGGTGDLLVYRINGSSRVYLGRVGVCCGVSNHEGNLIGPMPVTGTYYVLQRVKGFRDEPTHATMDRRDSIPLVLNTPVTFNWAGLEHYIPFKFNGTAGQPVSVVLSASPGCYSSSPKAYYALVKPDSTIVKQGQFTTATTSIGPLPSTGSYSLILNHNTVGTTSGVLPLISGGGAQTSSVIYKACTIKLTSP